MNTERCHDQWLNNLSDNCCLRNWIFYKYQKVARLLDNCNYIRTDRSGSQSGSISCYPETAAKLTYMIAVLLYIVYTILDSCKALSMHGGAKIIPWFVMSRLRNVRDILGPGNGWKRTFSRKLYICFCTIQVSIQNTQSGVLVQILHGDTSVNKIASDRLRVQQETWMNGR